MRSRAPVLALLLVVAHAILAASPDAHQHVIESIATQVAGRYVIPEKGTAIAAALRAKASSGAYAQITEDSRLAEALRNDLREISGDLHFDVVVDPGLAQRLIAAGAETRRKLPDLPPTPAELTRMRRTNYGFRRAELLEGNVGRLDITRFENLDVSRRAAIAAMELVANTDALIIDLRNNPGGTGNSVRFLASYFFPKPTALLTQYDRETGETRTSQSLAKVPGRRLPDLPLFLLAGPGTGSAAEAFAFVLQETGRAVVVGERTQGAAQGGGWVPAGDAFVVFIPNFRAISPRTGRNWERTGVQPDLPATSENALAVAHLRAVSLIEQKEPGPELQWLIPLLDLAANGPAPADISGLSGAYEGITVRAEGNALKFIGSSGLTRDVTALRDHTFLIEDRSVPATAQARLRFVRNADGVVTGLELLVPGGRVIPRARR